jgi:MSHA biogenesis protein MshP
MGMCWNQKGVSLIAAIFIIVILAFMGVMFVSLIGTSSITAVNDLQSARALYVAEGGVEYAQNSLAQNLDWYRSASDPMPAPASTTLNLGAGSFTVAAHLPATTLRKRLLSGELNTITVYTTDGFPNAGTLQIDDDAGLGNGEFVTYAGKTATTFTTLARGVAVGGIPGGTADNYARGIRVYPVATLSGTNLVNNCNTIPNPFQITSNSKFLSAGTINVYDRTTLVNEEITYTGSSAVGGVTTLTGVQRCRNGTLVPATANAGDPVTPINVDVPAAAPDYEAEIVSTGTAGSAVRVVKKTVQR